MVHNSVENSALELTSRCLLSTLQSTIRLGSKSLSFILPTSSASKEQTLNSKKEAQLVQDEKSFTRCNDTNVLFNFLLTNFKMPSKVKKSFRYKRKLDHLISWQKISFILILLFVNYPRSEAKPQFVDTEPLNQVKHQDSRDNFHDDPQPLVYMSLHDSGSGQGNPSSSSIGSRGFAFDSSSSVSPSIITAKCWNNYEEDNDCKHLNVISAPNANEETRQDENDDRIITPVVIFESASTIEPEQENSYDNQIPAVFYSSSPRSENPNNNVVLSRHRTPPTVNEVSTASTSMPTWTNGAIEESGNDLYINRQWHRPATDSNRPTPNVVTRPTTKVYVATPQPSRPSKTTTTGRTCRDDNDDDCDEPTEIGKSDQDDPKANSNEDDDSEDSNDSDKRSESKFVGSNKKPKNGKSFTIAKNPVGDIQIGGDPGSGDGPDGGDDNEDDDSSTDDDDDGLTESSGSSETPTTMRVGGHSRTESTSYLEVTSTFYRPPVTVATTVSSTGLSVGSPKPEASIEVVVHPTLPPSFPITSSMNTRLEFDPTDGSVSLKSITSTPGTTTTTIMPDDTFTSRPIFPPSTSPSTATALDGSSKAGKDQIVKDPDTQANSSASVSGLEQFHPLPLQHHYPSQKLKSNGSYEWGDGRPIAPEHTFVVSPKPPVNVFSPTSLPKFLHSWQHPTKGSIPFRPSQASLEDQITTTPGQNSGQPAKNQQRDEHPPRMQPEILSTLLMYSSILILTITAIIFVAMSFAFWRRSSQRHKSLLQKTNLVNGQNGFLGDPMSRGGQLMGNLQQPSLLTTYALSGPGMNQLGKVTTSIVKSGDDLVPDEGESRDLDIDQSRDQLIDGSVGTADMTLNPNMENRRNVGNSSRSSEDQTTSSGNSQRTVDGNGRNQVSNPQSSSRAPRLHYQPNEHQNNSSLSDSQGSPDHNSIHQNGQSNHQTNGHFPGQFIVGHQEPRGPIGYDSQHSQQYNRNHMIQGQIRHNQPIHDQRVLIGPPLMPPDRNGHVEMTPNYPQQVPMVRNCPPQMNGIPGPCIRNDGLAQTAEYPPINGDLGLRNGGPQAPNGIYRPDLEAQFNQPISQARVAMNPLATLGRRYQPGVGLNRNIFSEGSSSFMTTSPSLVRTSSSSSFAFNNSNHGTPVRGKPALAAGEHIFNDFTPDSSYANGLSQPIVAGPQPPPILGRKDRSEAWYV